MGAVRLRYNVMLALGLTFGLFLPSQTMAQEKEDWSRPIFVTINEIPVKDQPNKPYLLRNNRLYVPVDFFEHSSIQANISEFVDDGGFYATLINHKTHLNINTNWEYYIYSYNDIEYDEREIGKWEDSSPFVDNDKLMIPLRTVAQIMGIQVKWDKTTNTVLLISDKQYQDELDPVEDWEMWMAEKPMDDEDTSGAAITDVELMSYFKQNNLSVIDYEIISKYTAVVLEMNDSESSVYAVNRLRNGDLGVDLSIVSGADEEGVTVHRTHGFVSIAVHESAKVHEIEYCVIQTFYNKGEVKKEKLIFEEKQGFLVPVPEKASGIVTFYGKKGFIHEVFFW